MGVQGGKFDGIIHFHGKTGVWFTIDRRRADLSSSNRNEPSRDGCPSIMYRSPDDAHVHDNQFCDRRNAR